MGHTITQHFDQSDEVVREVYRTILSISNQFGPVAEDPKKTSIHLNRKSAFAGIKTRRTFLILTVKAANDITDGRISKREQASANRWHHEIKISTVDEIDAEMIGWLRDSFELSG